MNQAMAPLADRALSVGGVNWKPASERGDDLYGGVIASARAKGAASNNAVVVAGAADSAPAPPPPVRRGIVRPLPKSRMGGRAVEGGSVGCRDA